MWNAKRRIRGFFGIPRPVSRNPILHSLLALILFAMSSGGLALTAYADQYVNGGVAWGPDYPYVNNTDINPMGVNTFLEKEVDRANVDKTLQMARDGGFTWIRQGFPWNDIEISAKGNYTDTRNPGQAVNAWDKYDYIVNAAQRYGLQIIARLDSPPNWARKPGDDLEKYRKGPPNNNQDFADFAAAVASRYKGKINYFQIWNEPNLEGEWGGHPIDPEQYTNLLKAAHDAIKQVNPSAVIITAALAPTAEDSLRNLNDVLFLEGMYQAGAAPYFDILSTMLYGLGQSPDTRRVDLKYLSFSRPILLRNVMEKYGDTRKPIWISEYAWISIPPDFKGDLSKNIWGPSVDEQTQAEWLVQGYERASAEWPWMGVMFVWFLRQPDPLPGEPANYFSILRQDFTPRPAYTALQNYSKRFPQADVGRHGTDSPALSLSRGWQINLPGAQRLASNPAVYTATIRFEGNSLRADMALDGVANVSINGGTPRLLTSSPGTTSYILADNLAYGPHTASIRLQPQPGSPSPNPKLVDFEVVRDKPLWNALGFPLLYGLFGLLAIASVGLGGAGLSRWAEATLNIPRGRYSDAARETARNGAAIMGMALLAALYYRANSLPLVGLTLAGWGLLAFLKPSTGLAAVAFTIPFFWQPKAIGAERFPLAETLLLLVFGAMIARHVMGFFLPALAARLNIEPRRPAASDTDAPPSHVPSSQQPTIAAEAERPPSARRATSFTQHSAITRFLAWNRTDPFAPPAVAMLLLGAFSLLTVADPAFIKDSARQYRWVIIEPVLFYFLLTEAATTRRAVLRVVDFFTAGAVGVALYGIWQFAGNANTLIVEGVSRVMSVYTHPNNLALYLGRVVPIAICLAIFLPWGRRKLAYALAAIPLTLTLVLTYSRGAWLGVAAGLALAIFVGWRIAPGGRVRGLPRIAWAAAVGILILLVGAIIVLAPTLPERILDLSSGSLRTLIWESSLNMLRDHPIFGVGLDQFLNQFQNHYMVKGLEGESFTAHPHNIFLDYWLSLGIMGLIILLWLLWKYLRVAMDAIRRLSSQAWADPPGRALALGLLASMSDFLVHGLLDNSYFLMDLAMIFWMSCALLQITASRLNAEAASPGVEP